MSGELKHGPLAMIDAEMRIIMIVTKDRLYEASPPITRATLTCQNVLSGLFLF